jgi:2-C-methyl-D-erythritol 4-phosphate cytidylyltransferase
LNIDGIEEGRAMMQPNQPPPETSAKGSGNTWAIVLAGGEGSRLRSLTKTESGVAVPKQYCSLRGGDSLLFEALERARSVASPEHILTVVSQAHRCWWEPALSAMAQIGIVVQLRNCGTRQWHLVAAAVYPGTGS